MALFILGLFVGAGIGLVGAAMLGANGPYTGDHPSQGVLDLLATIHGDGGHHTEAVGLEQSVKDATHLVDAWKVEP